LRESTVLDLSRRGVLPAFKIGKHGAIGAPISPNRSRIAVKPPTHTVIRRRDRPEAILLGAANAGSLSSTASNEAGAPAGRVEHGAVGVG
jgi:hypothetical protein